MKLRAKTICLYGFLIVAGVLTFSSAKSYTGNVLIYLLFTLSFNSLLILGFCKHKIFFDTFIGLFFWLGFWFKFSVRIACMAGLFQEPVGLFDFSGAAYDRALLVSSCGALGLLLAHFVRRSFFSYNRNVELTSRMESLYGFYRNNRRVILGLFCFLFLAVAYTNIMYGIYQRGTVPRMVLPFGLNGVYTWLLLFGLSSFSAVILDCEFQQNRNPYTASVISLLECFFSNSAMLSRGMILNGSSVLFGMNETAKRRAVHLSNFFKVTVIVAFAGLFALSVFAVNHIRMFRHAAPALEKRSGPVPDHARIVRAASSYTVSGTPDRTGSPVTVEKSRKRKFPDREIPKPQDVGLDWMLDWEVFYITAGKNIKLLLIDRWVGIEGTMAVSSYPRLGWGLWKKAWQEKFSHTGTSLYDQTILFSPYVKLDLAEFHFINLPGILAFLYYPGSYLFLFGGMFVAGIFGAAMEWFVYRFGGGNVILCALMAQVLAYRYAHFGYAPGQTYMLLGTMVLNVIAVYVLIKVASLAQAPGRPALPQ